MKKVNKILLLIFSIVISLTSCMDSAKEKQYNALANADFPSVITQIEAKDTATSGVGYLYKYSMKRVNGSAWEFNANIKLAVGDTITIGIDTSYAYLKVLALHETANMPPAITAISTGDSLLNIVKEERADADSLFHVLDTL